MAWTHTPLPPVVVQAFALDELGCRGFFSARYEVTDVRASLQALVADVDSAFIDTVAAMGMHTLRSHTHRATTQDVDEKAINILARSPACLPQPCASRVSPTRSSPRWLCVQAPRLQHPDCGGGDGAVVVVSRVLE